jgi:phosphoribosylformylglycinamidine cyclo-ligase
VQTNGLSLCRLIADRLPQGYQTPVGHGDGRTYGQALLAASAIYVGFVVQCQLAGVKLNYVAHVTGHGWRKLMRLEEPFVYEIAQPGEIPALFRFLMQAGPISLREAYATFNMGVGFAAIVSPPAVAATLAAAKAAGHAAWVAGTVRQEGQRKAVCVPSADLVFEGDTLQVR